MANTLHGPFTKGASLSTGSYGTGGGQVNTYTSGNANNDETQSGVALASINPDLIGAGFILTGVTCAKDGTTASQLDIASGEAYLLQSDGTLARCDIGAGQTESTTGHASATMYLDLNPDGSWSWGTSHSAVTNHLTICTVTTDGSANIATVTDTRPLNASLLSGLSGGLNLPPLAGGLTTKFNLNGSTQTFQVWWAPDETFAALQLTPGGLLQFVLNGTVTPLALSASGGLGIIGGQATVGGFGAPVIVAQAINTHVTATGDQTILTYSVGATGLYEINATAYFGNTSAEAITFRAVWTDPNSAGASTACFAYVGSANPTTAPVSLSGSEATLSPAQTIPVLPITVYAKTGTNIIVHWNDPAGTPNDFISALIKRLS